MQKKIVISSFNRIITLLTLFEPKLAFLGRELREGEQGAAFAYVKTLCEIAGINEGVVFQAAGIRFKYLREDARRKEKANFSMADAVKVALAESLNAPVLTGDKGLRQVNKVSFLP